MRLKSAGNHGTLWAKSTIFQGLISFLKWRNYVLLWHLKWKGNLFSVGLFEFVVMAILRNFEFCHSFVWVILLKVVCNFLTYGLMISHSPEIAMQNVAMFLRSVPNWEIVEPLPDIGK